MKAHTPYLATKVLLLLLTSLLACAARPTLSGDADTDDGSSSGGSPPGGSTSSSGGSSGGSSSSGSSSSSGGTDTGWTDTDGGAFIQEPDGGYPGYECDTFLQDCPEGEKCMPWSNDGGSSWNAWKCTPIAPDPKDLGEPCTVEGSGVSGIDDCKEGAMCWDVDPETLEGYCIGFCLGSPDAPTCEDPCAVCIMYGDGVVNLCYASCDPVAQDCPGGDLCVPSAGGDGFVCVLDASGDEGQYKDPCEYVNVCDPGLLCADADFVPGCLGSMGCCTPYCDLANGNLDCPDTNQGVECVPWWEEGYEPDLPCVESEVGACVIPW
jgi:hypothetical protein